MLLNSLDPRAFAENDALALRYASFVQHAWNPAIGRFRNFMGYDRHWLEEGGSEDSNGRALWALGHRSEEQTYELQSLMRISYAVFCLNKKTITILHYNI